MTELPPGYDERTQMALTFDNRITAHHPELPTLVYDEAARKWVEMTTQRGHAGAE